MEAVEFSADFHAHLTPPDCELRFEDCRGRAGYAIRVHGCAFYFVCTRCTYTFTKNVTVSYDQFKNMVCSGCKTKYTRRRYFEIIRL